MKRWLLALLSFALAPTVWAQSFFTVELNGANAGTPSSGTGFGTFQLVGNRINYDISYSGLSGTPVNAHFHELPSTVVIMFLTPTGTLTAASGRYLGSGTFAPAQVASLLEGRQYINIHTDAPFGGPGEIRGTIVAVPEASTGWLVLVALAGWALRRWIPGGRGRAGMGDYFCFFPKRPEKTDLPCNSRC